MKLKLEFQNYFWYDKVMDILDFTDDYYAIWLNEAKEDDDKGKRNVRFEAEPDNGLVDRFL